MTIAKLAHYLQEKLGTLADTLAKKTNFIKRQNKVKGSNFAQTLILGWLHQPNASLTELVCNGHFRHLHITPQGLDKRFTESAAHFFCELLKHIIKEHWNSHEKVELSLFERFTSVRLIDSTIMELPATLAEVWRGTGSKSTTNRAALKVEVALDLKHGTVLGTLMPGKQHDSQGELALADLPKDSLHIADLGYFSLKRMKQLAQQGVYWLSRLRVDTQVYDEEGNELDLINLDKKEQVLTVTLGRDQRLPAQLFLYPVPEHVAAERRRKMKIAAQKNGRTPDSKSLALCSFTLLISNVTDFTLQQAQALYKSRWQIEMMFKLWKESIQVNSSVSTKPWRLLCELYAKLTGAFIQHFILVTTSAWRRPDRSLVKAYKIISNHAMCLSRLWDFLDELIEVFLQIEQQLQAIAYQNKRKKKPNTWKTLADCSVSPAA